MRISDLVKNFNLQATALKSLADKGFLEQYQVEASRFQNREVIEQKYKLSAEQNSAFQSKFHFSNDRYSRFFQ